MYLVMDLVFLVHLTMLCTSIIMTCDLRQLCTLNLFYVVIPHCSIKVSSISYNAHVEYSRLFQYGCYKIIGNKYSSRTRSYFWQESMIGLLSVI